MGPLQEPRDLNNVSTFPKNKEHPSIDHRFVLRKHQDHQERGPFRGLERDS